MTKSALNPVQIPCSQNLWAPLQIITIIYCVKILPTNSAYITSTEYFLYRVSDAKFSVLWVESLFPSNFLSKPMSICTSARWYGRQYWLLIPCFLFPLGEFMFPASKVSLWWIVKSHGLCGHIHSSWHEPFWHSRCIGHTLAICHSTSRRLHNHFTMSSLAPFPHTHARTHKLCVRACVPAQAAAAAAAATTTTTTTSLLERWSRISDLLPELRNFIYVK